MSKSKSDTKKAETQENVVDPQATAPSKGSEDAKERATATEPNSKERLAMRVSRTGRGNGGGEDRNFGRVGVGAAFEPDTLGEREGVPPSDHDLIWTNGSKDNWQNGQPEFGALLKQHAKVNEQVEEKSKK